MSSSHKQRDVGSFMVVIATILFPIVAALGMRWVGPWPVIGFLVVLLLLRAFLPSAVPAPRELTIGLLAVVLLELGVSLYDPEVAARLYPFFMNVCLLLAFAFTLWKPPSMIERFARLSEPALNARGIHYTYVVTWVWVGFFALNGAIAAWTAFYASLSLWAFYNGVISYLLIGMLFAVEYAIRRIVRSRGEVA